MEWQELRTVQQDITSGALVHVHGLCVCVCVCEYVLEGEGGMGGVGGSLTKQYIQEITSDR